MQTHAKEGVINAAELYTLRQIQHRLGLTVSALRGLRRRGLPIIRIGKRAYASGKQVIEFFERQFSYGNADQGQGCQCGAEVPATAVDRSDHRPGPPEVGKDQQAK